MKEFVLKRTFSPENGKIDYKNELNEQQLDVVLHGDGAALVLAGAGSGKTRTITYRVAYLLENGVAPENILLVTFTNRAAREMIERVEGLLHEYPTGLWAGTFHSIASRILRVNAHEIGRSPNFTILDTEDTKDLLKLCVKELSVDTTGRRFPSPANLYSMISYHRNSGRTLEDVVESKYPNFFDLIPLIVRIAELYELRKRAADSVDFDDLLLLLRDMLLNRPLIRERLAQQFQFILVDEYQDTNIVQAEIIKALASIHNNILVVGDDAQSIYSFRAANIKNILNFDQVYGGAKTFRLTTNYRSTPEILALANASIKMNFGQFEKDLVSVTDSAEKPNIIPAQNAREEAQYIAEQILVLRDEGIDLAEMAVLFRAAFHSQALEFELMKRDIPYDYRGGMKFFERAHVKDIVSHLRLISNMKDEAAWMRVLGLQTGIGLATAGKILSQLRGIDSIDQVLDLSVKLGARASRGFEQFRITLKHMLGTDRSPSSMIRAIITGGYRDYVEAEYPDFMERLDDLEQFALFAEGYDDLVKFLEEVSLTEEYGAKRNKSVPKDDEKMVLSTIHQAKGLEWGAVFVMNLAEGKFPNQRALEEEDGLEEERRLFYVATTRAKQQLFLTYPITTGGDALFIQQPSCFLDELPNELTEQIRLKRSYNPPTYTPKKPSYKIATESRKVSSVFNDFEPTITLDDFGEETDDNDDASSGSSFLGSY